MAKARKISPRAGKIKIADRPNRGSISELRLLTPGRAIILGPSIDVAGTRHMTSSSWIQAQLEKIRFHPFDLRVGVDGGVDLWLELGIAPDIAVGDWDSTKIRIDKDLRLAKTRIMTLPVRKDRSDLYFALRLVEDTQVALEHEIIALGFTGGRPDHHLSNLNEFATFAAEHPHKKVAAFGPDADYTWVVPKMPMKFEAKKGSLISVFAWGGTAKGVTMTGLEYKMKNQALEPSSRGLSNRVVSNHGEISVKRGALLVIQSV